MAADETRVIAILETVRSERDYLRTRNNELNEKVRLYDTFFKIMDRITSTDRITGNGHNATDHEFDRIITFFKREHELRVNADINAKRFAEGQDSARKSRDMEMLSQLNDNQGDKIELDRNAVTEKRPRAGRSNPASNGQVSASKGVGPFG